MECSDCAGVGWTKFYPVIGSDWYIKEWCPYCKGTGEIKYEGNRDGIEWEGE